MPQLLGGELKKDEVGCGVWGCGGGGGCGGGEGVVMSCGSDWVGLIVMMMKSGRFQSLRTWFRREA